MEIQDNQLVQRAKNGDMDAFSRLVDKYKYKLFAIAYHLTGNRADAEDIAQESFIKAYRNLRRFKERSRFYTWLYRILINTATDFLRKRGRRGEYEYFDELDADNYTREFAMLPKRPNPARRAEAGELRGLISKAIDELPVKQRTVLVLHDLNGLHHKEIAKILKTTQGTVRSRLHYARSKLQGKLKKYL